MVMAEDLSDMPVHDEVRDALRAMIARGLDPLEVADAAFSVATALSLAIEGEVRTGAKLYATGAALMQASAPAADEGAHGHH